MATIIDALVVTLSLDPSGFRKGRQQAEAELAAMRKDAQDTADEIARIRRGSTGATKAEDQAKIKSLQDLQASQRKAIRETAAAQKAETEASKKQAEGIKSTKDAFVELGATIVAAVGLKDFIVSTVMGEAATGRLAANLGVATEQLSTFEGVTRRAGGTAKDGADALQALVSAYQEFQLTGSTGHDQDFNALGISAQTLKDPVATLKAFAAASERMSKPEFVARMSRIGISPGMINALEKGSKGFDQLYASAYRANRVTEADAKAGQDLQTAWINATDSLGQAGREMLTAVAPGLTAILNGTTALIQAMPGLTKIVLGLGAALVTLKSAAGVLGIVKALTGIGGKAAAGEAAAGSGAIGTVAAAVTPIAGPLVFAYALAKPTAANVGEAEQLKALHADENARRAAAGKKPPYQPRPIGNEAFALIASREGFRDKAYWDRNHFRVGYGSDTTTGPDGRVTSVDANTTTTREAAKADLIRRINAEFLPKAMKASGAAWSGLTAAAQAALVDIAYNYGSVPASVAKAAKSGNSAALAAAIRARGVDNGGINAGRREQEALLVSGGLSAQRLASAGITTVNRGPVTNTTTINGGVNITTAATDAKGIAGSIVPALKDRGMAYQVNTGLSG